MLVIDAHGWVANPKIKQEPRATIEHGPLSSIRAVILHRTAAPTAKSTLEAWKSKQEGAHFLISENGVIYQCASLKQKCWHAGKLYARCTKEKSCSKEEADTLDALLRKPKASWGERFRLVTNHELEKKYPERYPHNHDSLGIEVVGAIAKSGGEYPSVSDIVLNSLTWLLDELSTSYSLTLNDIYAHGDIAHKEPSEGKTILQQYTKAKK